MSCCGGGAIRRTSRSTFISGAIVLCLVVNVCINDEDEKEYALCTLCVWAACQDIGGGRVGQEERRLEVP